MRPLADWQTIGPYQGRTNPAFATPELLADLAQLPVWLASPDARMLQTGRHQTRRLRLGAAATAPDVAVKSFGAQSPLKDHCDRLWRGSKAARTFDAAQGLTARGIGTPTPLACLEHWQNGRYVESHFVSLYVPGLVSFRDELIRLFAEEPECAYFMELLEHVAQAVRQLHDAGFQHRDLGNQNILLGPGAQRQAQRVYFIDLNRGRLGAPLSPRSRARDLSRIWLPSDFRRVFFEMYWQAVPPRAFRRWERFDRGLFALHCATRHLRHPRRAAARAVSTVPNYPPPRDQWVWDERSAQPVPTLRARDRRRFHAPRLPFQLASAAAQAASAVRAHGRDLQREAFGAPVLFDRSLAVAISGQAETLEREVALLHELNVRDVLVRFNHHANMARQAETLRTVRTLVEAGFRVAGAMLQDRRTVREPERWREFCHEVLACVGGQLEWLEFGHAINRVKWGLWGLEDYDRLLRVLPELRQAYPGLPMVGPAVIDSAFPFAQAALTRLPPGCAWDAISMHLYVDRRGAPENRQGRWDTLDKFVAARALARGSAGRCADRLIVSEVNWPLLGTGVWSPVGAPYTSPGPRRNDPSVSESDYADYLTRYLLLATCSGLVQQTVVWRLAAHGFGLVDDQPAEHWRRRPAFEALRVLNQTLGGGHFLRRLPVPGADPRHTYLLACATAANTPVLVGWSHGNPVQIDVPPAFGCAQDAQGEPVTLPSDRRLTLGSRPVYLFG